MEDVRFYTIKAQVSRCVRSQKYSRTPVRMSARSTLRMLNSVVAIVSMGILADGLKSGLLDRHVGAHCLRLYDVVYC